MQTYSTEEWKFILEFEVKRNGEGLWGQIFVDNLGEIRSMIYEHHFDKWLPSLCEADEKLSSTKCYEWSLNAMVTVNLWDWWLYGQVICIEDDLNFGDDPI